MIGTTGATGWSLVAPGCCAASPVHAQSSSSSAGRSAAGPRTRVRRHPRVHERRVVGAQALGVEPGVHEIVGGEVDDDHVGACREIRHDAVSFGNDLLGAVRVAPQRFVLRRRAGRRVDAEHARAVLAEVHRRDRARRARPTGPAPSRRRTHAPTRQEFPMVCSSMLAIFLRASSRLAGSHSDGHRPSTGL